MEKTASWHRISGILAAGLIVPIIVAYVLLSSTPAISPEDAARRLVEPGEKAVLVDVRSRNEFEAFSLLKAISLPAASMTERAVTEKVLKGAESVFLICDTGFDGSMAVRTLQRLGYRNVMNVAGGMDAWLASAAAIDNTVRVRGGERAGVTAVSWPLLDQAAIVTAAFGLKPSYQIISLLIILLIWRRTDTDLTAIKWALAAFLVGENACAANYFFFDEHSLLMEFLHMYGMILCFGFIAYALMEALDKRVLHFSDRERRCALLPQCGRCYKYDTTRCTLLSLFTLLIPAAMILALMPLTASITHRLYRGEIFGTAAVFGQPLAYQYLEARIFPAVSLIFLAASLTALLRHREEGFEISKRRLAIGVGFLGFSLLRFLCYWGYQDRPLWADVWEEGTEFLFILILLWIALKARADKTPRPSVLANKNELADRL